MLLHDLKVGKNVQNAVGFPKLLTPSDALFLVFKGRFHDLHNYDDTTAFAFATTVTTAFLSSTTAKIANHYKCDYSFCL